MRFCSAQCSLALSGGQLGLGGLAAQLGVEFRPTRQFA